MRPELEINGHHDTLLPSQWLGSVTPTMGIIEKISSWEEKATVNSYVGCVWLIPNVFKLWLINGN